MRYDDRYPYWEALILVRKLLLEIIAATLGNSPWAQLAICALLFGVSLWLQLRHRPFVSTALNRIERDVLIACVALVALGTLAYAGTPSLPVAILFFLLLAVTLVSVGRQMRRIWSGDDDQDSALEWRVRSGSTEKEHPMWQEGSATAGPVEMVDNPMARHEQPGDEDEATQRGRATADLVVRSTSGSMVQSTV